MQNLPYTNFSKFLITRIWLYNVTNIIVNILVKFDEYMDTSKMATIYKPNHF
jgi:hypothetical protein